MRPLGDLLRRGSHHHQLTIIIIIIITDKARFIQPSAESIRYDCAKESIKAKHGVSNSKYEPPARWSKLANWNIKVTMNVQCNSCSS